MSNDEMICLFCLEQSTIENTVIEFSLHKNMHEMPCICRFNIHVECWMIYFLKKGGYECPICHAKLESPPDTIRVVQNITFQTNNSSYAIAVPVDTSQTIHIEIPTSNREDKCINTRNMVVCSLCCLLLLGVLTLAFTQAR